MDYIQAPFRISMLYFRQVVNYRIPYDFTISGLVLKGLPRPAAANAYHKVFTHEIFFRGV